MISSTMPRVGSSGGFSRSVGSSLVMMALSLYCAASCRPIGPSAPNSTRRNIAQGMPSSGWTPKAAPISSRGREHMAYPLPAAMRAVAKRMGPGCTR